MSPKRGGKQPSRDNMPLQMVWVDWLHHDSESRNFQCCRRNIFVLWEAFWWPTYLTPEVSSHAWAVSWLLTDAYLSQVIYLPQLFDLLFKFRLWGQLYVLPYFILCFSASAPKSFLLILFPLPCMSGVIGLREAKQALPCSQLGMHSLAPGFSCWVRGPSD